MHGVAGPEAALAPLFDAEVRFDTLLEKMRRARALGKRERMRLLVLSSVARQLLDNPARRPAIKTVIEETGLSRGTFYNDFNDIDECVVSLMSAFCKALRSRRSFSATAASRRKALDPVYEANLWYCMAYQTNAGLSQPTLRSRPTRRNCCACVKR